jgi:hypothetical protein
MPYNPLLPANGSQIVAAELRGQFTGLKTLLDAGAVTAAQTGTIDTLPPGSPATAGVTLNAGTLTFSFGIPEGLPGEVTQAQLSNDLLNCQNAAVSTALPLTSANSNAVDVLGQSAAVSYEPLQLQAVLDKLDELINALRR